MTGTGAAVSEPDVVVLSIGVSVQKDSVKQARADAAEAMAGVIESLKGNGLLDPDIQTQHFSIHKQFDYIKGQVEFRGYSVTNTVSAKIRDLDTVGNVIDDAAEAGGDLVQINSIQFSIDDTTKLKNASPRGGNAGCTSKGTDLSNGRRSHAWKANLYLRVRGFLCAAAYRFRPCIRRGGGRRGYTHPIWSTSHHGNGECHLRN